MVRNGDILRLDCQSGELNNLADAAGRKMEEIDTEADQQTWGRALFSVFRQNVSSADQGASFLV